VDPGSFTWLKELLVTLAAIVQRVGAATKPSNPEELGLIRQALITAGYRRENAALLYTGGRFLSAVILVMCVALIPVRLLGFPSAQMLVLFYAASALAGYYLPNLWLRLTIHRRKQRIVHAVPDALDLLVVCVEAGLGLDMAIARVSDEIKFTHKDLGDEFHIVSFELRTGIPRADALRNLARRTDLEDMRTLVALLVQTDRFGTSVGQALRVHADGMRVTRQLRAEALAAKLPIKLLFPLIFFIFPNLFIAIMGPAVIKIVRVLFPIMRGTGHG
jgi:tight adherence protein C